MGKIALVFAGQGAQYPGMGKSLYEVSAAARAVFDLAERLRPGTLTQCFEGTKEELTVTEIARRLGVNKSTVSRCLRRARQRLYSRLRFTL